MKEKEPGTPLPLWHPSPFGNPLGSGRKTGIPKSKKKSPHFCELPDKPINACCTAERDELP